MSTVMEVESVATRLQDSCDVLNDLARLAQLQEITSDDAAEQALPIFESVLEAARELPDKEARALLDAFRNRVVPSVVKAWDPWISEAWPTRDGEGPIIVWICSTPV